MLSVSQLANKLGISRTTVLYYERKGLLAPKYRSDNGYRWYGPAEEARLESIVSFRRSGVSVAQILNLLDRKSAESQFQILKGHLLDLGSEIQQLKLQQKAIIAYLQDPKLLEENMVTKARWVEIMKAAGFDDDAMTVWHQTFEKMEPVEHQKFLESLGISAEEIAKIRNF